MENIHNVMTFRKKKRYWMIKTLALYVLVCELTHDNENDMF